MERAAIYGIDADRYFSAAVDAVLLVTQFRPGASNREAHVFGDLTESDKPRLIGYEDHMLLADIDAYHHWKHLCGRNARTWRSGIKHDCAKVMELFREGEKYRNGLAQVVELEDAHVYPMLKSSSLARGQGSSGRVMLVTQKAVGEDTKEIEELAPKTWAYLQSHAELLGHRASSIYCGRPAFAIFGVGPYSFAPWKVAISGFYKKLAFVPVGPVQGKPVVFDDTSYFVPCDSREQAYFLASLLNSPPAQSFFRAFVFWDGKRPITAELLQRLDLRRLARELGVAERFAVLFKPSLAEGRNKNVDQPKHDAQLELWAS